MSMSLNEVEAIAKRAARGAGYPWGLAEEAARATRWLCAHGIDGCATLADLLVAIDGQDLGEWAPCLRDGSWSPIGARLCPISAGAALSDRARTLPSRGCRLQHCAQPLLLAPFAAGIAVQIGVPIGLSWEATTVATDGENLSVAGRIVDFADAVTVSPGGPFASTVPRRSRADPTPQALATLNSFAHRTYAPATDASRLSGAGAGLSDND